MGNVQCKDGYFIAQRWVVYSTKMCSMHNVQYKEEQHAVQRWVVCGTKMSCMQCKDG